jgi:hypothetical protein
VELQKFRRTLPQKLENNVGGCVDKNYKINLVGVDNLTEEVLGTLIDNLVDLYTAKFGLGITLEEPERPRYDEEDLSVAKDYLKKYRLAK